MEQWLEILKLFLQLGLGGAIIAGSLIGLKMILNSQERQVKSTSDAIKSLSDVVAGLRDIVVQMDAFRRGQLAGSGTHAVAGPTPNTGVTP